MTIKICGITREADYCLAASLGADYLGFVFYPQSKRFIDPQTAGWIGRTLSEGKPLRVGVFVNASVNEINRVVAVAGLDLVQLHGEEAPDFHEQIACPCWKGIRIGSQSDIDDMELYHHWSGLVADSRIDGLYGGSGKSVGAELAWEIVERFPNVMLAGGIGCDNLMEFISLNPGGIDLSSSLEEAAGIKSAEKMRSFFNVYSRLLNNS